MQQRYSKDRTFFSEDKRMSILEKTGCKCARCGKLLSLKSMTVEHIVPVSKGGTNEDINLIALCYNCNQDKKNFVVSPRAYYNYIPYDLLVQIQEHYAQFLKDVPWYGKYNYTKEDKKLIPYATNLYGRVFKTRNGRMVNCFHQNLILEKVLIDSLGEAIDVVKEYNKKFGLDTSEIDEIMWDMFRHGCIYKLHKNNDIIAVLPFGIKTVEEDGEKYYRLYLRGIMCKYKKPEYIDAIAKAISYVTVCLSETNDYGLNICDMLIHTANPFNTAILEALKAYPYASTDEDGFEFWRIRYISPNVENQKESRFLYEQTSELAEDRKLKIISEGFERRLGLPSLKEGEEKKEVIEEIKQEYTNNKKRNTAKRPKRIKYEVDEYDLDFYK